MLSRNIVSIARGRGLLRAKHLQDASVILNRARVAQFHASRLLQAETIKVPQMAESISEGTLKSWSKQEGDTVAADEEVATIETDKIDVSVNAPQAGKIVKLLANEEDTVTVGQDLFVLEPGDFSESSSPAPPPPKEEQSPSETEEKPKPKDATEPSDQQTDKSLPESPTPSSAEKKADKPKEEKYPKKEKEDKKDKKDKKDKDSFSPAPRPVAGTRNETRVKMNRMRLRIAERLKQSQNAAASLTTFNEIDMSALVALRKKYKDSIQKEHDVKLGFMSFFSKACVLALQEIPVANASIEGEEIVYRDFVDLSIAVATPKGLVTPVVRNAESLSLLDIEREISSLGKKARDGKLTLEDMTGGSFTISNGGVFGSLYGTPIINLPQSAVLGMHTIKDRAVVVDGQIVIRPIMIIALTYDHRLLDGREATTFLVKVKEYLEEPAKMLLAA
ncbi:hypothetical protein NLJ89_g7116 [Agrocybe chaxingu]|uniref:dihydrolipoyllysine-residue succinyltransferase n=1 Tax=Agrocybe chaxingu TaxID=84603 RepID=A0A9W8MVC8_9AGAR|nr:hypothetical protein NLJ89_g7116 [Agrocybe chaxingu]